MFLIFLLRRICNYIENDKLLNEKFGHFLQRKKKKKKKKKETCFSYNTFAYYVCWEVQFSSRIYRGGIKTFFVIFEGLFEWWVDQTRVGSCEFKNKVASCNKNYNLQH